MLKKKLVLPDFSRYEIDADGKVNSIDGKEIKPYLSNSGYYTYSLIDDNGKKRSVGRHRLVAFYHHGPAPSANSVANHINGIKGDDDPTNIEWTSPRGNVEHAGEIGLTSKCLPVSVRNVETGEVKDFPSIIAAARSLNVSKDTLIWRLKGREARVHPDGTQIRYRRNDSNWEVEEERKFGRSVSVAVRDNLLCEDWIFGNQSKASEHTGVALSTINVACNDSDQPLIKGRWQFKHLVDSTPWRYCKVGETKIHVPVEVYCTKTHRLFTFRSASECAKVMGLKPSTLNERLNSNGDKVFSDGYRYSRLTNKC